MPLSVARIVGGAVLGGLAGWLLGNVRTCSSEACRTRANRVYSIVAGAVFGAGVGAYFGS
jgi:hypothetical protein